MYTLHKSFVILFVALITSSYATHLSAGNIILENTTNNVTIKGKLLKYNGRQYIISSTYFGRMTVNSKDYNCTQGACPVSIERTANFPKNTGQLGIAGSNIIGAELMPALIDAHAKTIGASTKRIFSNDPQFLKVKITDALGLNLAAINLTTRGSKTSFPALAKGNAQIALYSQSNTGLKAKKNRIKAKGKILALDGIQVIISPNNPLNALSLEQLASIFSGRIQNWSQLGAPAGKINVHLPGQSSGIRNIFEELVLKPHNYKLKKTAKSYLSNNELSDAVAKDPYSIGFTSLALKRNAKPIAISTPCSAAKFPQAFDIKTEEYPLSFRHYLYVKKIKNSKYAKKLVHFSLSAKAQKTIRDHGFIDLTPISLDFSNQADRIITGVASATEDFNVTLINQFNRLFSNAKRLSITFRFDESGTQLDRKSKEDLKYASRLFQAAHYRNKSIYLVGFTDMRGSTDQNIIQALGLADSIKTAIIDASRGKIKPYRLNVRGYGELLPVACNNTERDRYKNRRVEVWIK